MGSHSSDIFPALKQRYDFVRHLQSKSGGEVGTSIRTELNLILKSGQRPNPIFEQMAIILCDSPEEHCIELLEWYLGDNRKNWEQLVLSLSKIVDETSYYDPHNSFRRVVNKAQNCAVCPNKLKIGATLRLHSCGKCVVHATCYGRCKHTPTNPMARSASEDRQGVQGSQPKQKSGGTKRATPEDEDQGSTSPWAAAQERRSLLEDVKCRHE